MMYILPPAIDEPTFWASVHGQPLDYWQPALDTIRDRHNLPHRAWVRFSLGKNIVFGSDTAVIKLSPPFWVTDLHCEAEVLRFIAGQLPVSTPAVIAYGKLDTWAYLVMERVRGESLRWRWPQLTEAQQLSVAHQHGEMMAALHALPLPDGEFCADFPWWQPMLTDQREQSAKRLRHDGIPEILLADLEPFLQRVQPLLDADTAHVLLHGDLTALNLQIDDSAQLVGLIDWGDTKIGPRAHEYISPGTHFYRGQRPFLHEWYAGYGQPLTTDLQLNIMARSMLYYAGEDGYFKRVLEAVPGALACSTWEAVAACCWHMR